VTIGGPSERNLSVRTWVWLIALVVLATAINITKAFHVDDPFHMKVAQWIATHPFHPMSGSINWSGSVQYFHEGNQPPLFFYGMAAWAWVFGWGEIAMHAYEALFTVLAIVMFHRLALMVVPRGAWLLTGLLAAGPAFIVNQNVMLDVPLLALEVTFLHAVMCAIRERRERHVVFAGLLLGAACLMKYTALAYLPALVFAAWQVRGRAWWGCIILVLILGCWSAWNVWEFGSMHLVARSGAGLPIDDVPVRSLTWVLVTGAIAPWSIFTLLPGSRLRLLGVSVALVLYLVAMIAVFLAYSGMLEPIEPVLRFLFIGNGLVGILGVLQALRKGPMAPRVKALLLLMLVPPVLLIITYAPWMATRHVLLTLPVLLLLGGNALCHVTKPIDVVLIASTALLGVGLGISDVRLAEFYRRTPGEIALMYPEHTRWYTGSMGWGWYAEAAGFKDAASEHRGFTAKDLVAVPWDFSVPDPMTGPEFMTDTVLVQPIGPWDRLATRHWLRFYSVRFPDLPWTVARGRPERVEIKVRKVP